MATALAVRPNQMSLLQLGLGRLLWLFALNETRTAMYYPLLFDQLVGAGPLWVIVESTSRFVCLHLIIFNNSSRIDLWLLWNPLKLECLPFDSLRAGRQTKLCHLCDILKSLRVKIWLQLQLRNLVQLAILRHVCVGSTINVLDLFLLFLVLGNELIVKIVRIGLQEKRVGVPGQGLVHVEWSPRLSEIEGTCRLRS